MDDGLNVVKEGWFTELSSMWPGQGLSLEVKEILFRERSKFQVSTNLRSGLQDAVNDRRFKEYLCSATASPLWLSIGRVVGFNGTVA